MLTGIMALVGVIASGLATIFSYGNIALSVSVFYNVLNTIVIGLLLKKLFKIYDLLPGIKDAVNALNERIKHD